jgi:hypothetical protein
MHFLVCPVLLVTTSTYRVARLCPSAVPRGARACEFISDRWSRQGLRIRIIRLPSEDCQHAHAMPHAAAYIHGHAPRMGAHKAHVQRTTCTADTLEMTGATADNDNLKIFSSRGAVPCHRVGIPLRAAAVTPHPSRLGAKTCVHGPTSYRIPHDGRSHAPRQYYPGPDYLPSTGKTRLTHTQGHAHTHARGAREITAPAPKRNRAVPVATAFWGLSGRRMGTVWAESGRFGLF